MSLSKGKGRVDASTGGRGDKSKSVQDDFQKVSIGSRRLKSREVPDYDMQKDFASDLTEKEIQEQTAGECYAEGMNTKTEAWSPGGAYSSGGDSRYDDPGVEDDDARGIARDEDPECPSSYVEQDGTVAWNRRLWANAIDHDKNKAKALKTEKQFAKAPSYFLLLAKSRLGNTICRINKSLDYKEGWELKELLDKRDKFQNTQDRLEQWIVEHRPKLAGYHYPQMLDTKPQSALKELIALDVQYGVANVNVKTQATSSDKTPPTSNKAVSPTPDAWRSMPQKLYSAEYKGRTIVVPEWVRFLIKQRMRDLAKSQQAYKGIANLHVLFSQLLYWFEPKDKDGTPRATGKQVQNYPHVGWLVAWSGHRLSKQTGLSRSAVESAARRLKVLGLISRVTFHTTGKMWYRITPENFAETVDTWHATQPKRNLKKSKK